MGSRFKIEKIIDVGMTISLLLLMPYSLLGETAHEWIGMVMFVLFIIHHILNRRWFRAIAKGKYKLLRIIQTLLAFIMFILIIGSMVTGILLSNHLFKEINIAGISMEARQVHIFCAYWGFLVMSIHLGMHWSRVVTMVGKLFKKPSSFRCFEVRLITFFMACYGIYAFYKRQIGNYLLMRMHFVFYDYTENVMFFILDYLAVMVFIAMIGYYISKLLKKK